MLCYRPVLEVIELLLDPVGHHEVSDDEEGCLFEYPPISSKGLPPPEPGLLVHPLVTPVGWPAYFPHLYTLLSKIKALEHEISTVKMERATSLDKIVKTKRLSKQKVAYMARFLNKASHQLGPEGMELVCPYIVQLFEDINSGVQAAWSLFNVVSQALGPRSTGVQFLPLITRLMDNDCLTPKHMKLYHRSFIIQLIVRLGLARFIKFFIPILIEAVAGYKNFHGEDFVDRQLSDESGIVHAEDMLELDEEEEFPVPDDVFR